MRSSSQVITFQIQTELSSEPKTTHFPSCENARDNTASELPAICALTYPHLHSRYELSNPTRQNHAGRVRGEWNGRHHIPMAVEDMLYLIAKFQASSHEPTDVTRPESLFPLSPHFKYELTRLKPTPRASRHVHDVFHRTPLLQTHHHLRYAPKQRRIFLTHKFLLESQVKTEWYVLREWRLEASKLVYRHWRASLNSNSMDLYSACALAIPTKSFIWKTSINCALTGRVSSTLARNMKPE